MRGLDEAIRLAKHQKARLRLLHVVDKVIFAPTVETAHRLAEMRKALRADGRRLIKKAAALVNKHGLKADGAMREIAGGRAAEGIVEEAKQWGRM